MRKPAEGLTPMRSMLFVPADDEKKLGKGASIGADALILDLEDAVSLARKPAARTLAAQYIWRTRCAARGVRGSTCASTRSTPICGRTTSPAIGGSAARRHAAAQGALRRGRAHALDRAEHGGRARRRPDRVDAHHRDRHRSAGLAASAPHLRRFEHAARRPDLGRGRSVRCPGRAHQSRGRRPHVDLALPARARSHACSRPPPPMCSRSIPCSSISATRRACAWNAGPRCATASPARWRSTPTRWPS